MTMRKSPRPSSPGHVAFQKEVAGALLREAFAKGARTVKDRACLLVLPWSVPAPALRRDNSAAFSP